MIWIFAACADCQRMGFTDPGAFSLRSMATSATKKGILDLLLFKKSMRDYLLTSWMPRKAFPDNVKAQLKDVTVSHETYRAKLRPYTLDNLGKEIEPKPVNLEWKKGWPRSAELFLQLLEGLAFDKEYDPSLKNGIKNRKAPEELLDYAQVKEIGRDKPKLKGFWV